MNNLKERTPRKWRTQTFSKTPATAKAELALAAPLMKFTREQMQRTIANGLKYGLLVDARRKQPGNRWKK